MEVGLSDVRCSYGGFSKLASLWRAISKVRDTSIIIDCLSLDWIDANMAAALGPIVARAKLQGNRVQMKNLQPRIRDILRRNQFLPDIIDDTYGTTIPFERFESSEHEAFDTYIDEELNRPEMPEMSKYLEYKFFEGIHEIFNNSAIHSESKLGIFCCGQYFPKKHLISFTMSDAGIGIRQNVKKQLGLLMEPEKAIEWAMEEGSTTRQLDVPGGLGLKIVKEFIEANQGRFIVVSDGGFWCQSPTGTEVKSMMNSFPGTSVTLEIRTDDSSLYYLEGETQSTDL